MTDKIEVEKLAVIKERENRDLDTLVDENTLVAGETGAGVFGVFKFFQGIKAFFKGITALGTLAKTNKIPVLQDDGSLKFTTPADITSGLATTTELNNVLAKFNFSGATELNANTNLDDIKTEGLYFCNGAILPINAPDTTPKSYNCLIKVSKQGNVNRYVQEFYSLNTKKTFIRNCGVAAVDVWSNWEAVVTETDLPNVLANYSTKTDLLSNIQWQDGYLHGNETQTATNEPQGDQSSTQLEITSNAIEITAGKYIFSIKSSTITPQIFWLCIGMFNADGSTNSRPSKIATSTCRNLEYEFTVPDNIKYIRVSYRTYGNCICELHKIS